MQGNGDYIRHWDDKFSSREWGRYPPEDLVRFMGRNYRDVDHGEVSVLEIGCGPGANLWFLHREGYRVAGIDGSPTAIAQAGHRLSEENRQLNKAEAELEVGNVVELPWQDNGFDLVIDIFAIYANTVEVIDKALEEVYRVLKPGGRFYSKTWGTGTSGFGSGIEIEPHTFDGIAHGPCFEMGVSHFFDEAEIRRRYQKFQIDAIDTIRRSDAVIDSQIEELICQCHKANDNPG